MLLLLLLLLLLLMMMMMMFVSCKENIAGRRCDKCEVGYAGFPRCYQCNCDAHGVTDDVCDQQTADCICKVPCNSLSCVSVTYMVIIIIVHYTTELVIYNWYKLDWRSEDGARKKHRTTDNVTSATSLSTFQIQLKPVSYTHLTLPTKRIV